MGHQKKQQKKHKARPCNKKDTSRIHTETLHKTEAQSHKMGHRDDLQGEHPRGILSPCSYNPLKRETPLQPPALGLVFVRGPRAGT